MHTFFGEYITIGVQEDVILSNFCSGRLCDHATKYHATLSSPCLIIDHIEESYRQIPLEQIGQLSQKTIPKSNSESWKEFISYIGSFFKTKFIYRKFSKTEFISRKFSKTEFIYRKFSKTEFIYRKFFSTKFISRIFSKLNSYIRSFSTRKNCWQRSYE